MNINIELIERWEPLVNKFANKWKGIEGMSQEDIKQELYITIMNVAKNFDDSRNIKFITFLHKAFSNRCIDLYRKAIDAKKISDYSKDATDEADEKPDAEKLIYKDTHKAISSFKKEEYFNDFENLSKSITNSLETKEINFLNLFNQGYKYVEMVEAGINVKAIRKSLRKKIDKNVFYS